MADTITIDEYSKYWKFQQIGGHIAHGRYSFVSIPSLNSVFPGGRREMYPLPPQNGGEWLLDMIITHTKKDVPSDSIANFIRPFMRIIRHPDVYILDSVLSLKLNVIEAVFSVFGGSKNQEVFNTNHGIIQRIIELRPNPSESLHTLRYLGEYLEPSPVYNPKLELSGNALRAFGSPPEKMSPVDYAIYTDQPTLAMQILSFTNCKITESVMKYPHANYAAKLVMYGYPVKNLVERGCNLNQRYGIVEYIFSEHRSQGGYFISRKIMDGARVQMYTRDLIEVFSELLENGCDFNKIFIHGQNVVLLYCLLVGKIDEGIWLLEKCGWPTGIVSCITPSESSPTGKITLEEYFEGVLLPKHTEFIESLSVREMEIMRSYFLKYSDGCTSRDTYLEPVDELSDSERTWFEGLEDHYKVVCLGLCRDLWRDRV